MTTTGPACQDARLSLGVYVLGAIDPGERTALETHLSGCALCRDELAALAALPALLGRVSEPQVVEVSRPGDDELLTALLARAEAELPRRRARRRVLVPLTLAAAVLVLVAGTVFGFMLRGPGTTTTIVQPRPTGPAATTSRPGAEQIIAENPRSKVRAEIGLWPRKGGTSMSIHLTGVKPGTRCHLIAVSSDGSRDTAAGWQIEVEGYGDYRGSTMILRPDLDRLEVVTTDGRTLITIPT
ncbi:zf-HC2 domain-containing protein [Actinocorallia longicatena]|uniref:Zf-HC2 domain-containing protein n=1 Tax=Actinocorallia longicatena TaxID=111803 RepID=A0ABP6QDL6_9ACTN